MNHCVTVNLIKYILTSIENKKTYRRNFNKGNYKDMRKYLTKLDWNNMLMNKTAIECWNILKYETGSIDDQLVPLKKTRKTVLKEIFVKRSY